MINKYFKINGIYSIQKPGISGPVDEEEDTKLGPKSYYKPQRVTKDKSIIAVI